MACAMHAAPPKCADDAGVPLPLALCPLRQLGLSRQHQGMLQALKTGAGVDRSAWESDVCDRDQGVCAGSAGGRRKCPIQQAFFMFSEADREWLRECLGKEACCHADMSYLSCPEVDAPKRALLVDWLVEVVDEFRLCQECLFLAVSLLDRFLAREAASVRAAHLQLLGVTCLWVAAKYEEVDPPALNDFVDMTDNSYAAGDLVRMEAILLSTLSFQLATPTPLHFLHTLLCHLGMQQQQQQQQQAEEEMQQQQQQQQTDHNSKRRRGSGGSSSAGVMARGGAHSFSGACSASDSMSSLDTLADGCCSCDSASSGSVASLTLSCYSDAGCVGGGRHSSAGSSDSSSNAASLAHLAEYLLELALLAPEALRFRPSVLAASALQLAASMLLTAAAASGDGSSSSNSNSSSDAVASLGGPAPAVTAATAAAAAAGAQRLRAASALCDGLGAASGTPLGGCVAALTRMHAWSRSRRQPLAVRDKYCAAARGCVASLPLRAAPQAGV